jgi:hypothetical protein
VWEAVFIVQEQCSAGSQNLFFNEPTEKRLGKQVVKFTSDLSKMIYNAVRVMQVLKKALILFQVFLNIH